LQELLTFKELDLLKELHIGTLRGQQLASGGNSLSIESEPGSTELLPKCSNRLSEADKKLSVASLVQADKVTEGSNRGYVSPKRTHRKTRSERSTGSSDLSVGNIDVLSVVLLTVVLLTVVLLPIARSVVSAKTFTRIVQPAPRQVSAIQGANRANRTKRTAIVWLGSIVLLCVLLYVLLYVLQDIVLRVLVSSYRLALLRGVLVGVKRTKGLELEF
jgi:hypothetical protein